jgi:hypothetical protein
MKDFLKKPFTIARGWWNILWSKLVKSGSEKKVKKSEKNR